MERLEHILDGAAARFPDRPALIFRERSWTYAQLRDEADRRAALLVAMGLAPGDVVAMTGLADDEAHLMFFACGRAGVTLFFLSPKYTAAERAPLLARARARYLITPTGERVDSASPIPTLPYALPGDADDAARAEATRRSAHGTADAPLLILTTSGTTGGASKLVLAAHRHCIWHHDVPVWWEQPGEIILRPSVSQLAIRIAPRIFAQGGTMLLSPALNPASLEAESARHGVTAIWGIPAVVRLLTENPHPPPTGLHIRLVRTGAAPLTPSLARASTARYGARIAQDYGSSEGGTMMHSEPDTPLDSVGKPLPGVTARIADEDGRNVPEGAVGELLIRTPGVMLGYVGDPVATAEVLRDGWLHTGDLARRDADGNYFLLGRTSLRINVGGLKVSPEEVEAVLEQHPAVREAVVLAAPDEARGEVVRAVIVPRGAPPTVGELRRFCREHLAGYKIPRVVEFRDELPRSHYGKVLRHLL